MENKNSAFLFLIIDTFGMDDNDKNFLCVPVTADVRVIRISYPITNNMNLYAIRISYPLTNDVTYTS